MYVNNARCMSIDIYTLHSIHIGHEKRAVTMTRKYLAGALEWPQLLLLKLFLCLYFDILFIIYNP